MPVPPAPLDPRLGPAFRISDGHAVGHSRNRLDARDLERPFHGARRRRSPLAEVDPDSPLVLDRAVREQVLRDAHAFAQVAPPHAFLARRSAAVALALPCDPGELLCVGVPAPHRAPRGVGVHGVQVRSHLVSVREVDGLAVTSPASTWAMLAGELTERELVILGDAIVCVPRDDRGRHVPQRQLATPHQLRAAAMVPGRRGRDALLRALELVRVGSMSPLESDVRLDLFAAGLPEPELDVEIRDEQGILIGIADARFERYRTIIEVEGDHHRISRAQWDRDIRKHAAYARLGYETVRLTSRNVRGPRPDAAAIVREVLTRRGWRG